MRRIIYAALALLLGTTTLVVDTTTQAAQAAPIAVYDGSAPDRAAASCWEIKQNNSRAASGVYWLYTPAMQAPEQFYCEQSYQGGGWVLIGKGRERWEENYIGNGDTSQLLNANALLNAPAAQYPAQTIDALVNNGRIDSLTDGILLRRSANTSGSSQNYANFRFADRDRWVWTLGDSHPLAWYSFNGGTKYSGSLPTFYLNTSSSYVSFTSSSLQDWSRGWSYGSSFSGGSTSSSSHLYTRTGRNARPMTWMYIRPQLRQANLQATAIADTGTQAIEQRALASSFAARQYWGVTGTFINTRREGDVEAQAFAQIGNTIYVGGNFRYVQRGSNTNTRVNQSALAAFDATTGEYISSFTPTFNHQVKSLLALPDGTLLVGGQFSQVNGKYAPAIVALDPITGEIAENWTLDLEQRVSGGIRLVRTLELDGNWVYMGGSFTHLKRTPETHAVYARNHARFDWTTGRPDPVWNPEFNGGVVDASVDPQTKNIYIGGYFERSRGQSAWMVAAFDTSDDEKLTRRNWNFTASYSSGTFQQAMGVAGDRVYVGGAQHSLFGYDQATLQRRSGSITLTGGDFQTIAVDHGVVYAGCHCQNYSYQDAYQYTLSGGWTQSDKIQWIGAWDGATGDFIPEFNPPFLGSNNSGAWGSFVAEDGTLWVGGDFTGSRISPSAGQWSGGFVRFPMRDHTAPSTPTGFTAVSSDSQSVTLRWVGSTDDRAGVVSYEILRDDRVIATTTANQITVPRAGNDRYFVRAIDEGMNRSASTAVVALGPDGGVPEYTGPEVIWPESTWNYWYSDQQPDQLWKNPEIQLPTRWKQGQAPIGRGTGALVNTELTGQFAQRPVVFYARKDVDLSRLAEDETIEIQTWADDGIVIYVNGEEVHRANMPDGVVHHGLNAHTPVQTAVALSQPVTFEVPRWVLRNGENTIAVSVHSNYRNTADVSFDLSAKIIEATITDPGPVADGVSWASPVWEYWYKAEAPSADWNQAGQVGSADWKLAEAPFGYGNHGGITTYLTEEFDSRPPALFARREFTVAEIPQGQTVRLFTWADDGLVVYVNGQEVGRERMPEGVITPNTYAHAAISSSNARAEGFEVEVPRDLLVEGTNTVAVSVHANYRNTPNLSFGMEPELHDITEPVVPEEPEEPGEPEEPSEPEEPIEPEEPQEPTGLAWSTSDWHYWYETDAPAPTWNQVSTDADDAGLSDWPQAQAPFGYGNSISLATQLRNDFDVRPAVLYVRREFTADHLPSDGVVRIETWADDGLVLYLNGQELTRVRMAEGNVGHNIFAHQAISSAAAVAEPVIVEIPVSDFVEGANVLAASVHANYRATPNRTFGLTAQIIE